MAGLVPFDRVEAFDVTVTASTAIAAPSSHDVSFPPGYVVGVEIIIPDGHLGLTGLQIAAAHTSVIPRNADAWIIANDEKIEWPLQGDFNSGSWQAITYNLDVFDHTFYLRFLVIELAHAAGGSIVPAPLAL